VRLTARVAALVAGVLIGTVGLAQAASAHVEVSAKPAQALARNAVISFDAEAESTSAGIASVRVVLPDGIAPADVTLASGPSGWVLTPTADGYEVKGTALPVKKNAVYAITVKQLPNATSVPFKTLVTYTNGDVDRWIEVPKAGEPEPDNPAPILKLSPAPSTAATTAAVITQSPSAPAVQTPEVTATADAAPSNGSSTGIWIAVAIAAVVIAGGLFFALRRRGGAPS
jgi:hypothetical protein